MAPGNASEARGDGSTRRGGLSRMDPLTLTEAAQLLDLSPITLRVQIRNGKLRAKKLGRDWFVTKAEVSRYRRDSLQQR